MIKTAIIGCGAIADEHAEMIKFINNCQLVGFCDREELMAKNMAQRFGINSYFTDAAKLINDTKPDVVHITTPPQSHFSLGKLCLESGCHVFIEKPFAINYEETRELINLANAKSLKLTAGHNMQYSHVSIKMKKLIEMGFLGGNPVHMESYYGYELGDERGAKALLGDKNHWVRKLPGKVLHNIISHGIAKIADYIDHNEMTVIAHGFTSPLLKKINETEIIDELRVIIHDKNDTTAYFTFSSRISPKMRLLNVYGTKNALVVDENHQTIIRIKGDKYKSYLDQFLPQIETGKQYFGNSIGNMKKFLKKNFHMGHSRKFLTEAFYESINRNTTVPLSYKSILATAKIMDEIFEQLHSKNSTEQNVENQFMENQMA